jgi:pentatricopeptide repeat protein
MKTEQVKGRTSTYNLLIKGFSQKKEIDEAVKLIQEMRAKQIRMDFNTYIPLLTKFVEQDSKGEETRRKNAKGEEQKVEKECKTRGGEEEARVLVDLLNQMKQDEVEMNVHTYNALIDDVARVGGQEAVRLFQDLLGKVEEVLVQEQKGEDREGREVREVEEKELSMDQRIRKFVAHQLELLDIENQVLLLLLSPSSFILFPLSFLLSSFSFLLLFLFFLFLFHFSVEDIRKEGVKEKG